MIGTQEILETGTDQLFKGVKMFGAITVAFFILLFALIAICFYGGLKILQQHDIMVQHAEAQEAQLDRMELEMNNAIDHSETIDAINSYFLKEICIALQDTKEGQKRCNPDPSILTKQ